MTVANSGGGIARPNIPPRASTGISEAMVNEVNPSAVLRRWGIIKATRTDGTVDVDVAGVTVSSIKRHASYQPTVGERVIIDVVGTDMVVVDATAPSPRAFRRPVGDIEPTIRKTPKPDTIFMHGQDLNRATYIELYNWVKAEGLFITGLFTETGGASGTTFKVPDFRGRVLSGADTLNPLGALFGADTHTIGVTNLPTHKHDVAVAAHAAHNHTFSGSSGNAGDHGHGFSTGGGGHGHSLPVDFTGNGTGHGHNARPGRVAEGPSDGGSGADAWTDSDGGHSHSGNTGGGGTHSHSVSGTIGNGGPTTHTVTETAVGAATPAAIDNNQPSVSVNWMMWV